MQKRFPAGFGDNVVFEICCFGQLSPGKMKIRVLKDEPLPGGWTSEMCFARLFLKPLFCFQIYYVPTAHPICLKACFRIVLCKVRIVCNFLLDFSELTTLTRAKHRVCDYVFVRNLNG